MSFEKLLKTPLQTGFFFNPIKDGSSDSHQPRSAVASGHIIQSRDLNKFSSSPWSVLWWTHVWSGSYFNYFSLKKQNVDDFWGLYGMWDSTALLPVAPKQFQELTAQHSQWLSHVRTNDCLPFSHLFHNCHASTRCSWLHISQLCFLNTNSVPTDGMGNFTAS